MTFRSLLLCLALLPAGAFAQAQPAALAGVPVSQSILDSYAGWYRADSGIRLHIWRDEKALKIQAEGQPAWILVAESETIFTVPAQQARITFGHDASNRADWLILTQSGSSVRAIRE